ncbi:hypothetical protein H0H81_002278 [Sphagnurus paluster]|uniref:Uncharacterized protein n=1 Tax=Sphagnurus paluster TaxID=117069 RepID=A0A9P7K6K6_9AGAR|nr:hypothetical protein H0H81_002278 [Sphagnurus paluster]
MPPSPTQTKTWFRPKGWFSEREETIAVTRILRDDPTKGQMDLFLNSLCQSSDLATCSFNTFQTNLLTIPSQVTGMITMFGITLLSETMNERSLVAMVEDIWALPFLVALYTLPKHPNQWKYFVGSIRRFA